MRVRQASSSAGLSSSKPENEAAPPKRPENGPPAQMRGGREGKCSEERVDVVDGAHLGAVGFAVGGDEPGAHGLED